MPTTWSRPVARCVGQGTPDRVAREIGSSPGDGVRHPRTLPPVPMNVDPTPPYRRRMDPFEALAEPVRRRIIEILASGEHTSGQVADAVGAEFRISRTAVSKHLRLLRNAGYVDVRAEENWRWYRLDREGFEALENTVAELRAKMDRAIGWDADTRQKHDPLAAFPARPAVPFRGPGRTPRRGRRGAQRSFAIRRTPDDIAPPSPPSPPIHLLNGPPGAHPSD